MGKLILCTGKITEEPYCFPLTNTKVYSMEELCYYIYNNIYSIGEELFYESLAHWIGSNLEMKETEEKLIKMITEKQSKKDLVVTVLCSGDYYEEQEIKELIKVMDQLEQMTDFERNKLKGDNFLKFKDYGNAKKVYESLLNSEEAKALSDMERGNMLHNLGVAKIHSSSYEDAASNFRQAYEKNQNEKSMYSCLLALKLGKKDEKYREILELFSIGEDMASHIANQLEIAMIEAEALKDYQKIEKIKELKENGQVEEYYMRLNNTVSRWKEEYKNGLL